MKKSSHSVIALAAIAFAASPAWAINKCTQADGSVAFQDAPCSGGKAEAITVRPASGHAQGVSTTDAATKAAASTSAVDARFEVHQAIERREPLIGMTLEELDQAMGKPDRANLANYDGRPHNQLIYERGARTLYVYTDGGRVKAIQNSESIAGTRKANVKCSSPMEIRSMETSASSITLSEEERVERLRQIWEAKKCGK